jgi:alkylation response protein AidB-like acyl-CoA dehydrogenase
VDFALSSEQQMMQDAAFRLLQADYDFATRAKAVDDAAPATPGLWHRFAEMGWLGLPFAEEYGGSGGTTFDVALLMQAMGRSLVIEPYFASVVLAGGLLAEIGSEDQKRQILPKLIAGDTKLALAFSDPQASDPMARSSVTERQEGQQVRLTGRRSIVLGAPSADLLIVKTRSAEEAGLSPGPASFYLVAANTAGLELRRYATIDGAGAADIVLNNVRVPLSARLGRSNSAEGGLRRVLERATVALCADALGAVEGAVALTRDYLQTREQFGKPLAANQALRHKLVDMFIAQEEIRSLVLFAARCLDLGDARSTKAVSAVKVMVGERGRKACEDAIQLHGGIAITDEYTVGHYLKRLTVIERLLGDTDFHLARFSKVL